MAAKKPKEKPPVVKAPSPNIGKYVICFQKVPKHDKPFKAQIVGEYSGYWLVKIGREKAEHKVNKGGCSSVPFRKEEIGTAAYRKKVLTQTTPNSGDRKGEKTPGGSPDVRKPSRKRTTPVKEPASSGRKRSGNRQDKKPAGGVGGKAAKGWGRITGNSS